MGKIYNIVLNSDLGSGANTNSKTYYFDWNKLPQGKYKVSFLFQTSITGIQGNSQPLIFINCGFSNNSSIVGSNATSYNSNYIGMIQPVAIAPVSSFFVANTTINTPILIDCIPSSNNFTVDILTTGLVPFTTSTIPKYVLVLCFKQFD